MLDGQISQTVLGYEFKFTSIRPYSDKKQVTIDYLAGGAFRGIGEKTAAKIVVVVFPALIRWAREGVPNNAAINIKKAHITPVFRFLILHNIYSRSEFGVLE